MDPGIVWGIAVGIKTLFERRSKKLKDCRRRQRLCRHCGTPRDETAQFCKDCGGKEHATVGEIEDAKLFIEKQRQADERRISESIEVLHGELKHLRSAMMRYKTLHLDSVSICNRCDILFETKHKFCTQCGNPTETPTETVISSIIARDHPKLVLTNEHSDLVALWKKKEADLLSKIVQLEDKKKALSYLTECPSHHSLILRDGVLICDICNWKP